MRLEPLFLSSNTLGLYTDLYELTMAAAYFESGSADQVATFELFTRQLPDKRNFLLAAGLEQALHYLDNVCFSEQDMEFLRSHPVFQHIRPAFFDYLKGFRFTGDVYALPEGTPFFENEPIIQIVAPIIEAQLLETYLINIVNFQSLIASKAARICLAAKGRPVIDFGSRRAHGPQAGLLAARAAFLAGCKGTSNVLASRLTGIPAFGTMAHSFIQFFDTEEEAIRVFVDTFPGSAVIPVDTYDTLSGVSKVVSLGRKVKGIRLDSGDLGDLAGKSRELLDSSGLNSLEIMASGNLNEEKLLALSLQDAPIGAYGVGTDLVVSSDAPSLDLVYKLVEVSRDREPIPRFKKSEAKTTLPWRKQVFRAARDGVFCGDLIGQWQETPAPTEGEVYSPLLQQFVKAGRLLVDLPDLFQIRTLAQEQMRRLPSHCRYLHTRETYPVQYSQTLLSTLAQLTRERSSTTP